jgi:hypothetical protein
MLPLIFSVLGSSMAGAGMLGALSPLVAGALGSGAGTMLQTGDLQQSLKSTLMSGVAGGLGGMLMRGVGGMPGPMQGPMPNGAVVNPGLGAMGGGIGGMLNTGMQTGFQPGVQAAAGTPLAQKLIGGLQQGTMTGAGLGTAAGAALSTPPPQVGSAIPGTGGDQDRERQQFMVRQRQHAPSESYAPGISPEYEYFDPRPFVPMMRSGGMVPTYRPTGMEPIRLAAGGIADIEASPGESANDKEVIQGAISAIRGELPRESATAVLGAFLQRFGEEAFRKLVDDVEEGRTPSREGGEVEGPGDGMDDMVPADMDSDGSDVLLSDGEFVIPADVVSGLGNGSTDAGAAELESMMDRVRMARTGNPEQPPQMATGGLLPV